MARKIVITSGKGGVGKTTVCANLGIKLANYGFKVLLVDSDIGLNNLDVVLGIEGKVVFDIVDIIQGKCRAKQALVQNPKHPSLFVLPSAENDFDGLVSAGKIADIVSKLEPNFDYVLVDCPAGVDSGFHRAVSVANEALVVVTPHISSLRDANKVVARLKNYPLTSINLVINQVRGDMLLSGEIISIEKIMELLGTKVLGVIPQDDTLLAQSAFSAFGHNCTGTRAFAILAENLQNGTKKIFDCTVKYRGFAGYIRRNLRRKI